MTFDKSLLQPCPVLRPNEVQFKSPIQYLSSPEVRALGEKYGLLKIVPPQGWKPPFALSPEFKFHTRIQKLSDLGITTRSRKFFTDNMNRFYKMMKRSEVKQWFRAGDKKVYFYDLYLAVLNKFGESPDFANISNEELSKLNLLFGVSADSRLLVDEWMYHIKPYAEYLFNNKDNYDFPESDPEDEGGACLICRKNHSPTLTLLCDHCNKPYHMRCLQPPLEEIPQGAWYCDRCLVGNGAYGFEERPDVKYSIWDFVEQCKAFEDDFLRKYQTDGKPLLLDDIERIFWSLVETENSDIKVKYGADIHNLKPGEISGFPTPELPHSPYDPTADASKYINDPWNLTRLPFAEGSLLNYINSSISGMTVPWIYVGSLLSTFCWHVEDHYTLSANYCHFGNVKKWYGFPSSHADAFELIMKKSAPDLFQRQPDLLHQLVTLISPSQLAAKGIPCVYADQGPNEFVVTFPRVYHAGFNSGFNFNEAVNFTMDSWIELGEKSIQDYRKIKKENVFDHCQLVENILNKFINNDKDMTIDRIKLVEQSIRCYERILVRNLRLVHDLDKERFQEAKSSKKKNRSGSPLTPGPEKSSRRIPDLDEEDDVLCDVCRTYVSYQYCNINNQAHRFGKWYGGRKKKESHSIDLKDLLTPEASPAKLQALNDDEKANFVAATISADRLGELQDKVPSNEEFEKLIKQAKRKADEEDNNTDKNKRRRHSSRILQKSQLPEIVKEESEVPHEAKSDMSQMKKVQHNTLFKQLNRYDNVKLCLECCVQVCGEHGKKAPRGSYVIFEKSFDDMEKTLAAAKQRYYEVRVERDNVTPKGRGMVTPTDAVVKTEVA